MIDRNAFLESLPFLQRYLKLHDENTESVLQKAYSSNPWFIPEFSRHAIDAIGENFLDEIKCKEWLSRYPRKNSHSKKVAIIMAGNVPLVGFHDLFCVLASGHHAIIKLSDKDSYLLKFVVEKWTEILPALAGHISFVEKLDEYDAVIATGSNNSARYFEYYFREHPHILRKNRNGVAVLTGSESPGDLEKLSDDIFLYFGLGCRNVSRLFVPEGYDFANWQTAMSKWNYLKDHNKYRNNLDYNSAIYLINRVPHINLDHLILKEDEMIASRIGCVHYTFYHDQNMLTEELNAKQNEIQCLISIEPISGCPHVKPGQSQYPSLGQYADGVDTMEFLRTL